jgi:hypothetical protein
VGEREPELNELDFLLGEPKKLVCRTDVPAPGFESLSLFALHGSPHEFVVAPEPLSAILNHTFGRGGCLLAENLQDDDGVRIDPVDNSPDLITTPNPKLVATRPNDGHRSGMGKRQFVALLQPSQKKPGFDPRFGREWWCLDLAL